MTFFETADGKGAVFSTGSITFCGSLPSNDYDNNISRLLTNVLNRFLDPRPFEVQA
jgi:N,N-dimethylformamidase